MARQRRDPRAERASHRVAAAGRPRYDLGQNPDPGQIAAAPSGRPRRDPRAERAAQSVATTPVSGRPARQRFDRTQRNAAVAAAATPTKPAAFAAAPPEVRVIADPAFLVMAVVDAPGGTLSDHDRQVLGAARLIADAGAAAVLLAAGPLDAPAGPAGADRVVTLGNRGGFLHDPDARAAAIVAVVEALSPRHVLFPDSIDGGDLARRVAAACGAWLFAGAEQVGARVVVRPARAGRKEQRSRPPRFLSIAADAVAPHSGVAHEGRAVSLDPIPFRSNRSGIPRCRPDAEPAVLSVETIPADPATVALSEAAFVVSAGNGVRDFDLFHALVAALHATPGASRVVCDAGLMPRAAQVGASGTVLDADCYFALGIAGAPQHLQGVARCRHVVAVNTDLHAAMIERAELAIIQDAQLVMPALLALLAREADPRRAGPAAPAAAEGDGR
ncbi:electron transfer flavoprotein alpha subunit apoprotein [Pseudoxanthobacter soli DSM 19599]|uniref:Electron transfer flavoprotein alpha subunit apoprotein n=1 Tax=Pseudoxanthobacter soli DSM 19599 TaxID=1123029 RepID=A0A1M7ZHI9_9HYPH|nr:electron transfer flavoprotein subunit alpha/FixB family protein [Pseudoxanthobacter soli]SHO64337.1 electron transfer flavoprotein alpha subunit apoprotein [Pseudoxanthobacter soli DSM 19599]